MNLPRGGHTVRVFLSILLMTGLLSTAVAPMLYAQGSDDTLIVPGKSIGAIRLGMSPGEVLRILGDPAQSGRDSSTRSWYLWFRNEGSHSYILDVKIIGSSVAAIYTEDPQYSTSDGIRAGASQLRIVSALGNPERHGLLKRPDTDEVYGEWYCYDRLGLLVQVSLPEGRVMQLWVLKPNSNCS